MKHLKTFMSVMILLLAVSCTRNHSEERGQVEFMVQSNDDIADQTKSYVSDFTSLPASRDFTISITDASSTSIWNGNISEWDASTKLLAGSYNVSASYGDIAEEGFDKPYFIGSAIFTITGGETSSVSVPVTLGNTIVKVVCTENFKNYYKDYSFQLKRSNQTIASFDKNETRGAFVDGYSFTLTGTFIGETSVKTFTKDFKNLNEATAYTILLDVLNVGGSNVTITFDNTVEVVELGDYELND